MGEAGLGGAQSQHLGNRDRRISGFKGSLGCIDHVSKQQKHRERMDGQAGFTHLLTRWIKGKLHFVSGCTQVYLHVLASRHAEHRLVWGSFNTLHLII